MTPFWTVSRAGVYGQGFSIERIDDTDRMVLASRRYDKAYWPDAWHSERNRANAHHFTTAEEAYQEGVRGIEIRFGVYDRPTRDRIIATLEVTRHPALPQARGERRV